MIIRVDPELLKQSADTMQGVASSISSIGSSLLAVTQALPNYDGQFGPQIESMGREANTKLGGYGIRLDNLATRLKAKGNEFALVDTAAVTQLAALGKDNNILYDWLQSIKNDENYFQLLASIQKWMMLGNIIHSNKINLAFTFLFSSLMGRSFLSIQYKTTFWTSWFPTRNPDETLTLPAKNNETKNDQESSQPQQKSEFGRLLELAQEESIERKKQEVSINTDVKEEQGLSEANKPKYINDFSPRANDDTFLAGQEKNDSCSIASVRMALIQVLKMEVSESDLRAASSKIDGGYQNNPNKWGTTPASLDNLINTAYGDSATAIYSNPFTQTVSDLENAVNESKGIIVSVRNSEWIGGNRAHSVTVVGVENVNEQKIILVNDPWPPGNGKRLAIPSDDFERAWYGDATYISGIVSE